MKSNKKKQWTLELEKPKWARKSQDKQRKAKKSKWKPGLILKGTCMTMFTIQKTAEWVTLMSWICLPETWKIHMYSMQNRTHLGLKL